MQGSDVPLLISIAVIVLAGCQGDSGQPSATERALDELQTRVENLTDGRTNEAVDWAQQDVENIGDWEYRIVELAGDDLEVQLNALGDERWEAYWVESSANGRRVFLKRPSISYLSRVPLSVLVRMLAGGAQ
jgi:hypothetical protein